MRAAVLVCLALAGCGRLGFASQDDGDGTDDTDEAVDDLPLDDAPLPLDAFMPDGTTTIDGPTACLSGRDEDGDLIPDECDRCPHLPSQANLDSDDDGVGDECDPEVNNPVQRIVRFDTFDELPAEWSVSGSATLSNGTVIIGGAGGNSISRPWTDGASTFVIGFSTSARAGEALVSIIAAESAAGQIYYCEIYDDAVEMLLQLTYTLDGTNYLHPDLQAMGGQLAGLAGTLEMRTGQSELCRSKTGLGEHVVDGTITGITPDRLVVYAQNITATIDWMIEIRTGP